jgi:hemimethylated DNA binding protein
MASSRRLAGVASLSGIIGFGLGRLGADDDTEPTFEEVVSMLQGEWEDEIEITIRISGTQARFTDDPSGVYEIEQREGDIMLRGARLVSLGEDSDMAPLWSFPWGTQHEWERLATNNIGDDQWEDVFRLYKGDRLDLWIELCSALCYAVGGESRQAKMLRDMWQDGSSLPRSPFAQLWRKQLLAGQNIVPGVCFTHRTFGYRGVVIGHDSKCIARSSWKAQMQVAQIPGGERQPFYHCIVDERDRPGGQLTYVAEVNVVPHFSERAFPVQADLIYPGCVRQV